MPNTNQPPVIYLDNAASTPLDPQVLEVMLPYLGNEYGNPSSVHRQGRVLRAAIEKARKTCADILGCSPAELIFTSGGTESDNCAIKSLVVGEKLERIITSPMEHHAVLHTVEDVARELGVEVIHLNPDENGELSLQELEGYLKQDKRTLVSLMHGNNELGVLLPLRAVGQLCRDHQAFFHSDTVQTIGLYDYNLAELPVDLITASAHKFYGPRGIGLLYRRPGLNLPPLVAGGGQERNQRAGTENVAGIVGLAEALRLMDANRAEKHAYIRSLRDQFVRGLRQHWPELRLNGLMAPEKSMPTVANVQFPLTEQEENMLLFNLDIQGVCASGGSACSSGSVSPSHVLSAIGRTPQEIAHSIRFSFGARNTQDDVDQTLAILQKLVGKTTAQI